MRNNQAAISKKIVALFVAAALAISALTIGARPAEAAPMVRYFEEMNGEGSIVYSAHRTGTNWAPCFATTCDAGSGPGATMYFTVYKLEGSTFVLVADGQADESGVTITGLQLGGTYFVSPEDCASCHESTHDVVFNNWHDCSDTRQRQFDITSATPLQGAAYYRMWEHGTPDEPVPCTPTDGSPSGGGGSTGGDTGGTGGDTGGSTSGGSTGSGDNTGGSTGGGSSGGIDTSGSSSNNQSPTILGVSYPVYYGSIARAKELFSQETFIAEDGRLTIPDENLSGKPIGDDPTVVYTEYDSLYDLAISDPVGTYLAYNAAILAGIDMDSLSEMQQCYVILKIRSA